MLLLTKLNGCRIVWISLSLRSTHSVSLVHLSFSLTWYFDVCNIRCVCVSIAAAFSRSLFSINMVFCLCRPFFRLNSMFLFECEYGRHMKKKSFQNHRCGTCSNLSSSNWFNSFINGPIKHITFGWGFDWNFPFFPVFASIFIGRRRNGPKILKFIFVHIIWVFKRFRERGNFSRVFAVHSGDNRSGAQMDLILIFMFTLMGNRYILKIAHLLSVITFLLWNSLLKLKVSKFICESKKMNETKNR